MKKYINIFAVLMVTLIGLSLTSCSEDDYSTYQYKGGVQLNVFGPSPVMRGGTLRFIGSNLDQVNQVIIPGVPAITNIEVVKAGGQSEIRVTVPKDGPEPGIVTLITNTDQEIKTLTPLAYSEPIVIDGINPASAMPGEEITIKGDYLNLIHMVEFTEGVYVSEKEFKAHDRYQITLVVPETAKSGKLSLYDFDITTIEEPGTDVSYNIIKTEDALNVGTPTIANLASVRTAQTEANGSVVAKAGEKITIVGEAFNLAASISVGDGEATVTEEFEVSEDGKTITFKLPETAPAGEIKIICRSGVEIPVGKVETIVPTELKVPATPAKNGTELTITGKDLDIVKMVTFPNSEAIEVKAEETKLVVVVPESAQEGEITLTMANNETVTVDYKLVKPTVTSYSASKVAAGSAMTINGTDLDLVSAVTFTGAEALAIETDGSVINLTVPMEAKTGTVTLNLKNGTNVEVQSIEVSEAEFCYAKTLPGEDDEVKAGQTMTIEVANADKLKEVKIDGTTCQYILQEPRLIIGIPLEANKKSTLELISSNGQISYAVAFIPNSERTTVIWTGLEKINDWKSSVNAGRELDWNSLADDSEIIVSFEKLNSGWGCLAVRDGDWAAIDASITNGQYDLDAPGAQKINIQLTAELKSILAKKHGILFSGHDIAISQVAILEHLPQEETIWEGTFSALGWKNGFQTLAWGGYDWSTVKAGNTLIIHFTADPDRGSDDVNIRFGNGNWAALPGTSELEGADGDGNIYMAPELKEYRLVLTQAIIDGLIAGNGLVICGKWFILTKVGIE